MSEENNQNAGPIARAQAKGLPVSPQKVRLIADAVRGKPVEQAVEYLRFNPTKSAALMLKVIESAIANAENRLNLDIDTLSLHRVFVDEGRTLKRIRPRAKGSADRILKRSSHITVELSE